MYSQHGMGGGKQLMLIHIMCIVPNVMRDLHKRIGQFGKMEVCRETTAQTAAQEWTVNRMDDDDFCSRGERKDD